MNPPTQDAGVNLEALHSAIRAVKALRSNFIDSVKLLADGAKHKDEDLERKYLQDLHQSFSNVNIRMRELETAVTLLGNVNAPIALINMGHLTQDPGLDRPALYNDLVKCFRWYDKCHDSAMHASAVLATNSLKRSHYHITSPLRIRRTPPTGHNIPPTNIDALILNTQRNLPELHVEIMRPHGSCTILKVTLDKTLKAVIILRGILIEWVLVKAFTEDFLTEEETKIHVRTELNKLNLWSPSQYQVFQKITEHANAAMLHFTRPAAPDYAFKPFMMWLHSYLHLFDATCRTCNKRLQNNLPPTWREYRNFQIYHETCRP